MDLSDFIALTLDQVMDGVTKASGIQRGSGRFGFINPMDGEKGDAFDSIPITDVKFDVAITVEANEGRKKSGGLNIKVLEAQIGSEKDRRIVGESRITFSVPVCLPTTKLMR